MTVKNILRTAAIATAGLLGSASAAFAVTAPPNNIPEPESALLFGVGLAAAVAFSVFRRRK